MFYIKCYDMTQTVILRLMQGGSLNEGIFVYEHLCDSMAEEIALTLDEDVNIIKLLLTALEKTKSIEFFDENTLMLSEMQDLIGSEGSSAARVRKHREKYKMLQCNSEVTNLLRRDRYR